MEPLGYTYFTSKNNAAGIKAMIDMFCLWSVSIIFVVLLPTLSAIEVFVWMSVIGGLFTYIMSRFINSLSNFYENVWALYKK